jgi:hypothetical protein
VSNPKNKLKSKGNFVSNFKNFFSNKGFLFTISVIMFASTLVIFAQNYSQINSSSEQQIIVSTKPLNLLMLNDDVSFDLQRLLGLSMDFNSSNLGSLTISGVIDSSANVSSALTNYETFLNNVLFPRIAGDQVIDISSMKDGKAALNFGNNLLLDYNYGNNMEFLSIGKPITGLDIDLDSTGSTIDYTWLDKSTGSVPVRIKYSNDSNGFYLSESLDANAVSTLQVFSPDGNVLLVFGKVTSSGVDYNSSFRISSPGKVNYSFTANYSNSNPLPVKINASIRNSSEKIDSNSTLVLRR